GGWSGLAATGGSGAITNGAGLHTALAFLKSYEPTSYANDLIQDKAITVEFQDLSVYGMDTAGAVWLSGTNTIAINTLYQNAYAGALAAFIAHEATHADYYYYPAYWVATTLERHPELTESDISIPADSVTQEYDAFCNTMTAWQEFRQEPFAFHDDWLDAYNQGEEYMRSAIQSSYAAMGIYLPEY
ncbi:MAG: hypothetical protein KKF80_00070, partial [Candidatus Omnitrophica bacterium]|nr:hypothetical protein [Candidatus Omnitrophota bacterium]